jgi:sterol-4alpha-carboxylate 3-dehydrogenase (decarboxylating)
MADQQDERSLGTVLVVGGCGFVGSSVVDQLLNFPTEDQSSTRTANGSTQNTTKFPSSRIIHSDHSFPSLRRRYPSYNQSNTKVHALDLRCTRNRYPGCTYHEADITSLSALSAVFDKVQPSIVINTASPHFDAHPDILKKVNIEGTRTLLEAAQSCPSVKAFVHTSSSSVVHDTLSPLHGVDEGWPYVCPNPREPYSETKVYAEKDVLAANETGEQKMLTCAVRPAGIIGEGDMAGFAYSVTKTATTAPNWQLQLQLGDGNNLFDLTYVGNVAYGLLCAAYALQETAKRRQEGKAPILDYEKIDGEAFNVTNAEPAYFWDSARFLWTAYGRNVDVEKAWLLSEGWALVAGWGSEIFAKMSGRKARYNRQTARYSCMVRYFSCEKLRERTGYEPIVGVEEALERTVRWFKEMEETEWKDGGEEKKKQ